MLRFGARPSSQPILRLVSANRPISQTRQFTTMAPSAKELLDQIEAFNQSEDHVELDLNVQTRLRLAATQLSRAVERPTDATSRVLCSQVRLQWLTPTDALLTAVSAC